MGNYDSKTKINSFLVALYIMQYTLILPFTKVMSATLLTAGTSLSILLLFVMLNGRIRLNFRFILVLAAVILAITLKTILVPSEDYSIFIVFAYTAFPAAFAIAYNYDARLVLEDLYKISLFSFILIFWYPVGGESSYMRFGYAVLPCVLFILCELLFEKNNKKRKLEKKAAGTICAILLAEMIVFGARGCLFSLLLFFAVEELLINRENLKTKIVLAAGVFYAYFSIGPILDLIYNILKTFGIRSYAIIKYRMQFRRGFDAASSGRDVMYDMVLEKLKRSPFLGLPITLSSEDGDVQYVHNLFLQTWMDLGIIGLVVLILFILIVMWKIRKKEIEWNERILVSAVFSIAIGRLMFSSVLWRRPEFWLLVFMSMKMRERRLGYPED